MQQNLDRFQFKCWDRDNGIFLPDGTFPLTGWIFDIHYIITIKTILSNPEKYSKRFTILQSTGLKDKNEKLIFEGDILKIKLNAAKEHIFKIIWNNNYACFDYKPQTNTENLIRYLDEAEIIGNIYETPQFLKKL